MTHYVAYYRASTDKQGRSGLRLDAQRQAVAAFVAGCGDTLAEFIEIESGRKNEDPSSPPTPRATGRKPASSSPSSRQDFDGPFLIGGILAILTVQILGSIISVHKKIFFLCRNLCITRPVEAVFQPVVIG